METLLKEYPKALATFLIGLLVTYLTGKIPESFLSPSIVSAAQVLLGTGFAVVLGRFIRLTKQEAAVIDTMKKNNDDPPSPSTPGIRLAVILVLFLSHYSFAARIQNAFPDLTFTMPTELVSAGDGRMFLTEKTGKVIVFENNYTADQKKTFINISSLISTGGQTGLMGIAFHPNYFVNGYFYLDYIKEDTLYISRFSVSSDPDSAVISSKLLLMKIAVLYPGHYGGKLAFGPDGYLYISTGDSGNGMDTSGTAARKLTSPWGKLLRIDVNNSSGGKNYSIPQGNPYYNTSYCQEIYARGFRNLWKFSFDNTGKLWAADVGEHHREEINWVVSGGDYGWCKREGNLCFPDSTSCDTSGMGLINPIFTYNHFTGPTNNNGSITGGYVSRDSISPTLFGKYLFADYVSGKIWSLQLPGSTQLYDSTLNFTTFGVSSSGDNFICSISGKIYRIRDNSTDVNYDGEQDLTDVLLVYNDMVAGRTGIVNTDINLDYEVNLTDLLTVY